MKKHVAVLILDDTRSLADDVRAVFKASGFAARVETAESRDDARRMLRDGAWDAVIAARPGRGVSLAEAVRLAKTAAADPPFIVVARRLDARAAVRFMRAGAHECLSRDDLESLPAVLQRELQRARRRLAQRKADDAFEISARKYRLLFDSASDAMFITDFTGRIIDANKIACVRLGYGRLELLRKSIGDIDPDESPAGVAERMERIKRLGHCIFERCHHAKNGDRFPVEVNARIIEFGGGQAVLSIVRDASERKAAEEALRLSESRLSEAIRFAKLGHWEYDILKDEFTFNDHFYAIFRTTAEAVGGYKMSAAEYSRRFIHPEDQGVVQEETRQAILSADPGYSRRLEHRMLYADGETGYIDVLIFVEKNAAGRSIRTYGVNQDVTERRKAEEALRLSEEKFRRLFQYSAAGIVLVGTDFRFLSANDAFCRMLGYSESELVQKTFQDVTHPDDRPVGEDLVRRTLAGERDAFQLEKRYLRRDGGIIWGLLISTLIRDQRRRPLYFVSQVQDVTARHEAERALRESENRYRELFEHINTGVAVYEAVDEGRDFIVKDFNAAGEKIDHDDRRRLVGRSIFAVRPGAEQFGLVAAFRSVRETGEAVCIPERHYRDDRLAGWYEHFIYRLPAGDIVDVFEDVTERKRMQEDLRWELKVQSALSALYTPIISPESGMPEIARVMLECALDLTGTGAATVSCRSLIRRRTRI